MIFVFFQENPAAGTFTSALITLGFVALLFWLRMTRPMMAAKVETPLFMKLVLAYIAWSGVSLLWTRADSSIVAFAYWAVMSLDVVSVWILMSMKDVEKIVESSIRGFVVGALALSVTVLLSGISEGGRLGQADFLHPNALGSQMALAVILCLYLVFGSHRGQLLFWLAVIAILLSTLFLSLSKTSIAGFFVALAGYVFFGRQSVRIKLGMSFLILLVSVFSLQMVVEYVEDYVFAAGEGYIETLSGRTLIWEETWEMIKENWVWGYGVMSFRDYGPQIVEGLRLIHPHNEWLSQWFSLGMMGPLLALGIYLSYWMYVRSPASVRVSARRSVLAVAVLIFSMVRGVTEANAIALICPITLMMLMGLNPSRKSA